MAGIGDANKVLGAFRPICTSGSLVVYFTINDQVSEKEEGAIL
jgi:hypothetical protein